MAAYLFKTIICSGVLYIFYLLFLEKEKMHVFNRFYLLAGFAISYLIPLITFSVKVPIKPLDLPVAEIPETTQFTVQQNDLSFTFINALWVIAIIISLFFLVRFIVGLINIYQTVKYNRQTMLDNKTVLINIEKAASPFSFGRYIFINEEEKDKRILLHELTHIRQKHWIDNIFMEIITIISWINPMVFLYKRAIKINHEFLADDAVIKHFGNIQAYSSLLLNKVFAQNKVSLASTFHFFITKKRLLMLHKKTSPLQSLLRVALCIPLAGALIFFVSERIYAQETPKVSETEKEQTIKQEGISENEMQQYKALAQKARKGEKKYYLNEKDSRQASQLYQKMSAGQKQEVKDLLMPPPPPPVKDKKGVPPPPPPPLKKAVSASGYKGADTIKINLKLREAEKKTAAHKEKITLALQKVKEARLKEKNIHTKIEQRRQEIKLNQQKIAKAEIEIQRARQQHTAAQKAIDKMWENQSNVRK